LGEKEGRELLKEEKAERKLPHKLRRPISKKDGMRGKGPTWRRCLGGKNGSQGTIGAWWFLVAVKMVEGERVGAKRGTGGTQVLGRE